jgi:hypothetical protein
MDLSWLSGAAAMVTAVTGLVVAISTRRKARTEHEAIVELTHYVEYLHTWIDMHTRVKRKPLSLKDYSAKVKTGL